MLWFSFFFILKIYISVQRVDHSKNFPATDPLFFVFEGNRFLRIGALLDVTGTVSANYLLLLLSKLKLA